MSEENWAVDNKYDELDKKIEELQEIVLEKHKEYNALVEELAVLLDERHPERRIERIKEALYESYINSGRSLDEIIELIEDADSYI